jgi:hypothetical protein
MAVVVVAAVGCKDGKKPPDRLDAACVAALRAGDAGAALRTCRPCGVSFAPLVALSSTDPDEVPEGLPGPVEVFEILDACQATCQGTARTEVAELLRSAQEGHTPAAPWRRIADKCEGALRLDKSSVPFARGTWYALDQIKRAIWADDAGAWVTPLRDDPPVFPLPPLTQASTGYAMPRVDALAAWRPRVHVTVTEKQVHVGALPWVILSKDGPKATSGFTRGYPGPEVEPGGVAAALRAIADRPDDDVPAGDAGPVVIAPRGLRASRVLEVIGELAQPVFLAATPKTRGAEPWPEPVFAIPVALAPRPDGAEPLVLPASSTVANLAEALAKLAEREVTRAYVTLDPLSSP